jgi:hypothetical protein
MIQNYNIFNKMTIWQRCYAFFFAPPKRILYICVSFTVTLIYYNLNRPICFKKIPVHEKNHTLGQRI